MEASNEDIDAENAISGVHMLRVQQVTMYEWGFRGSTRGQSSRTAGQRRTSTSCDRRWLAAVIAGLMTGTPACSPLSSRTLDLLTPLCRLLGSRSKVVSLLGYFLPKITPAYWTPLTAILNYKDLF
jgi:hypothetical protein